MIRVPVSIRDAFRKGYANIPLRISVIFMGVGAAWILLEHKVLGGPAIFKDIFFLLVTTWMLYWLVDHGLARIRRSEEALRVSEEHLKNILESNPCGVMLVDESRVLRYANSAAANILGAEPNGLRRKKIDADWEVFTADGTLVPPEDLPWKRVLEQGETLRDLEYSIKRPDGMRVILSVNSAPLLSPDGRIIGMVTSFFDVSERRMEELLTLQKLYLAAQQSPNALMITDADFVIEYVNPAFVRMTGQSEEEVIGTRATSLLEHSPEIVGEIHASLAANVRWTGISQSFRKNGEMIWESISVSAIRDQDGDISHSLWIREDITAKHQAEQAVRESEERFREIFEQNEEPVLIFQSGTTEVLDANPAAINLYGYSLEELKENGPSLFLVPDDRDRFEEWICGIRDQHPLSVDVTQHVRRDGTKILVSIRGKTIYLNEEVVSYCTFRDITARVRAEEQAKSRQAQLIHASRMASLGTMVSGVAHEINNPNNLIMFNIPMLRAAWSDAERILSRQFQEGEDIPVGGVPFSEMRGIIPRLFEGISEASRRIRNIVANLKDFSRQDKAQLDCSIDVNEVVKAAVAIINHEILKRTRNFQVEYGAPSPRVKGCAQQLEQVVINLVLNSLDALPGPGSRVRVVTSTNRESGTAEVRIEDEGSGMTGEVMARVTEPFFSTKTETGGLGLGLSLSSSIVKEHHGEMIFESEVGRGTTVRVVLPAIADTMEAAQQVSIPKYS